MNCIKNLNTLEEVEALVHEIQWRMASMFGDQAHYRGQGRLEYKLVPGISRGLVHPAALAAEEYRLIRDFQDQLRHYGIQDVLRIENNLDDRKNLWNILIQAQHFRVPTRLLDWSLKWEVALWFAVGNPNDDDSPGQFWVFTVPHEIHLTDRYEGYFNIDLDNLDRTYFINAPIHWSDRLKDQIAEIKRERQQGKFTISPYKTCSLPLEDQPEIAPYLEKYCIPAEVKGQMRLELTAKGYYNDWLYYLETDQRLLNEIVEALAK